MTELEYLNKMMEKLDERMDEQDSKLEQILVQTTKTNGRVNRLESFKEFAQRLGWWGFLALIAVVTFFLQQHFYKAEGKAAPQEQH